MQKIDFLAIFKNAWKMTKENRFLWWFGFFISFGGGIGNYSSSGDSKDGINNEHITAALEFIQQHIVLFGVLLCLIVVLIMGLFVMRKISQAAIIKAADNIALYQNLKFKGSFKVGRSYFWKMFLTDLLFCVFMVSIILLVVLPAAILFYFKSILMGGFMALGAFLILLPLLILTFMVRQYSYFFLVLADLQIKNSILRAYELFTKKSKESLLFLLIMAGFSILFFMVVMAAVLLIGGIFAAFGFLAYWLFAKTGAIVVAVLAVTLLLVGYLFAVSVFETVKQVAWVLFFKEIGILKVEEVEVAASSVETVIALPESV